MTNQQSSDPYDNIALFSQLSSEIRNEHEHLQEEGSFEKEPIFYPDRKHRNYKLRFHPLIIKTEDGKERIQVTREVWSHSGFEKTRRLPCLGIDCPICKETKKLKEIKHPDAWKYAARREYLIPTWIYESSTPKDYKWIRTGEYGYMVLRGKDYMALTKFLDNLSAEEMRQVLNPHVKAPRIIYMVSPGSEGSSAFSFDLKQDSLPPWPKDFPSINSVFVDIDAEPPTDEEMKTIKTTVNKHLAASTGTLCEPEDTDNNNNRGNVETAKSAVANALKDSVSTNSASRKCPGASEGLEWAKNPQVLNGSISVACLSCVFENDCQAATQAAYAV